MGSGLGLLGRAQSDRLNFPRNLIRNNTMQGGVGGSPGTAPTYWSIDGSENGLTRTLAFGTEGWIDYIDVRVAGTTTAASTYFVHFETAIRIPAVKDQVWNISVFCKLQAGSMTGISSLHIRHLEKNDMGADVAEAVGPAITPTVALIRYESTSTLTNPATAFLRPRIRFTYANSTAIDFTLRMGLPQANRGGFPAPPQKTFP